MILGRVKQLSLKAGEVEGGGREDLTIYSERGEIQERMNTLARGRSSQFHPLKAHGRVPHSFLGSSCIQYMCAATTPSQRGPDCLSLKPSVAIAEASDPPHRHRAQGCFRLTSGAQKTRPPLNRKGGMDEKMGEQKDGG
ncbi:uncharacterized protein LOC124154071 [Ischnura elegans]|uniref:uncharacterized protein LOC124154071 n=1 Tax=Ischnura elegans TaxID=197161 RepID=UPI001ED87E1C|nr:uncharacterized protein LOC124154071 [Ischnura elegans]